MILEGKLRDCYQRKKEVCQAARHSSVHYRRQETTSLWCWQFQKTHSQGKNSASCTHNSHSLESWNVWTPLHDAVFPVKLPSYYEDFALNPSHTFYFHCQNHKLASFATPFFPHIEYFHHIERINSKREGKDRVTEPYAGLPQRGWPGPFSGVHILYSWLRRNKHAWEL